MKFINLLHDVPFNHVTINYAVRDCASNFRTDCIEYDKSQLQSHSIVRDDSSDLIVIFEIGHPQHCGVSAEKMREWWPNAKFIALCCDTIYYQMNNLSPQLNPKLIDIHLEIMPQSHEFLRNHGADKVLNWHWGLSDTLINIAKDFRAKNNFDKKYDFIGVYHPDSLRTEGSQRKSLVEWINKNGYSFTNGGGSGHYDSDFSRLFKHFMESRWTLGTSSHNLSYLTRLGCKKGFRDDLGIILGTPLIYDYHQNLWSDYPDMAMPTYDYDDLDSIKYILKNCTNVNYLSLIEEQIKWVKDNSLSKQLIRIINHEFI